jgi:hypothetical protein
MSIFVVNEPGSDASIWIAVAGFARIQGLARPKN